MCLTACGMLQESELFTPVGAETGDMQSLETHFQHYYFNLQLFSLGCRPGSLDSGSSRHKYNPNLSDYLDKNLYQ